MKLVPVVVWLAALQLAALEFSFELPVVHAKPPGFKAGPQTLDLARWRNKRVMFIAAHPDDIEYVHAECSPRRVTRVSVQARGRGVRMLCAHCTARRDSEGRWYPMLSPLIYKSLH